MGRVDKVKKAAAVNLLAEVSKLPPQAPELEKAVLGAAMLQSDIFDEIGYLKADMFYVEAHSKIWTAITSVHDTGAMPDILLVTMELMKMGVMDGVDLSPHYISSLTDKVAGTSNVDFHARVIQEKWMLREQIRISEEVKNAAYDAGADVFDIADKMEKDLDLVLEGSRVESTITMTELADTELAKLDQPDVARQTSGWKSLDELLGGGWMPGDLIVVAARPGMGKTALAVGSALGGAIHGKHPSLFFEAEVSRTPFNDRLVAAHAGISLAALASRKCTQAELQRRHEAHDRFRSLPLFLNFASAPTFSDIRREARLHLRKHNISTIFIDQANWVKLPGEKERRDELGDLTRAARRFSKDTGITTVLLHQMSREVTSRVGHVPRLSDLKDSGSFEENAQGVILLHRPEYYGDAEDQYGPTLNRADVILAKYSMGKPGTIHLRFDPPTASFHDDWGSPLPPPPDNAPHPDDRIEPDPLPF